MVVGKVLAVTVGLATTCVRWRLLSSRASSRRWRVGEVTEAVVAERRDAAGVGVKSGIERTERACCNALYVMLPTSFMVEAAIPCL
jgi:hypothetical protein